MICPTCGSLPKKGEPCGARIRVSAPVYWDSAPRTADARQKRRQADRQEKTRQNKTRQGERSHTTACSKRRKQTLQAYNLYTATTTSSSSTATKTATAYCTYSSTSEYDSKGCNVIGRVALCKIMRTTRYSSMSVVKIKLISRLPSFVPSATHTYTTLRNTSRNGWRSRTSRLSQERMRASTHPRTSES